MSRRLQFNVIRNYKIDQNVLFFWFYIKIPTHIHILSYKISKLI